MPSITHHAQTLAARLPPLLLEAERVAHTVQQGMHGRRRAGAGESFWQFREYMSGDPAENIDWRQSARTTKYYVREREQEAAQQACIWADTSGSMDYASAANLPTKRNRAELLMLALAYLLLRGGEKVTWLDTTNPATVHGNYGLEQIALRLSAASQQSAPPTCPIPSHAAVILCSDFLMPEEALQKLTRDYTSLRGQGALIHILDPLEESFAFEGRLDLRGCENEPELILPNAAALRAAYRQKLALHKARLQNIAQSLGWTYVRHVTSELPHLTLTRLYNALTVA